MWSDQCLEIKMIGVWCLLVVVGALVTTLKIESDSLSTCLACACFYVVESSDIEIRDLSADIGGELIGDNSFDSQVGG